MVIRGKELLFLLWLGWVLVVREGKVSLCTT
jgi:hypothetical protein